MNSLYGLILAGGKSTRMGEDKGLIPYYGIEHRLYLAGLLVPFCDKVFISCNQHPPSKNESAVNYLMDCVPSKGPISGLLSAFQTHPESAWLVVPCDLPLFSSQHVKQLIGERDLNVLATLFKSPTRDVPEPLIGIWESASFPLIEKQFKEGNYRLRNLLKNDQIRLVTVRDPEGLTNVNTPEEKREFSLAHPSVQF